MRHLLAVALLFAVLGLTAAVTQAVRPGADLLWFLLAPARVLDRSICG